MKAILMSIQPKWCNLIAHGNKTIEVRKTKPKLETPFKVYMYQTKSRDNFIYKTYKVDDIRSGKVIGEFVCDWVSEVTPHWDLPQHINQYIHHYPAILGWNDCMSFEEMKGYLGNRKGWDLHISQLKNYDEPKELSEFKKGCNDMFDPQFGSYCVYCEEKCNIKRPPQSWCYVEEQDDDKTK